MNALVEEVKKIISPVLQTIQNATSIGCWDGIGGVKGILNDDLRLKMLANKSKNHHIEGWKMCFSSIVETAISKDNDTVLKNFISQYPDIILEISKRNPELFQNDNIQKICMSEMDKKSSKKFQKQITNKSECSMSLK